MKFVDCRIFSLIYLQLLGTEFADALVKLKCETVSNANFVKNTMPGTDSTPYRVCDIRENILDRNEEISIESMTRFGITAITASKCTWHFIPKEIFLVEGLKYLSLHNRSIESFKPDDFKNAKTLSTLFVKQNPRLTELGPYLFQHAKSLQYINLQENGLTFIHEKAFDELNSLAEIYLQSNFLLMIHSETFSLLTRNLKIVDLTNNTCLDFNFTSFSNSQFSQHVVSNSCQYYYQHYNNILSTELQWKSLNISIWSQLFSFIIAILAIMIVMFVVRLANSKPRIINP